MHPSNDAVGNAPAQMELIISQDPPAAKSLNQVIQRRLNQQKTK